MNKKDIEEFVNRAGKFEYVALLACQFPCGEVDEDGDYFEYPHYTAFGDDRTANKRIQELGLSEQSFYKQNSIIPVIEAYGLDKEKFWYAVVYIAQLTNSWARQKGFVHGLDPSVVQLTKMRDEIKGRKEFKVLIDNPTESHTFEMAGKHLMEVLVASLDRLIKKEKKSSWATAREIPLWRSDIQARKTEMTWYAASLFKLLFEKLNLPVLRARSTKTEYRTIEGKEVKLKGRSAEVSYDKNQLIAEIIHFLDFTNKPNLDGNSIRAILRSERKFALDII